MNTTNQESSPKPYVILAPHIDDEMIGCFDLLDRRLVSHIIYFDFSDVVRIKEAIAVAEKYDVSVMSWDESLSFEHDVETIKIRYPFLGSDTFLVMPSTSDKHSHHKMMNLLGMKLITIFGIRESFEYTVDMNPAVPYKSPEKKRKALYDAFPSQKAYLDKHDEAWLFESIKPRVNTRIMTTWKNEEKDLFFEVEINWNLRNQAMIESMTDANEIMNFLFLDAPFRDDIFIEVSVESISTDDFIQKLSYRNSA